MVEFFKLIFSCPILEHLVLSFQFYCDFFHGGCGDFRAPSWSCSSQPDGNFSFLSSVICYLTVSFYLPSARVMLGTLQSTEQNLQGNLACPKTGSMCLEVLICKELGL